MSDEKKDSPISVRNTEGLRPWKPGESGNPSGRPKTPDEIVKLRRLTKMEFADIAEMVIRGSWNELEEIANDPSQTVLRVKLAKGILDESYKTFDEILNRLIGKVKEEVDISMPKPTVIELLGGGKLILGSKKDDE